MSNRQGYYTSNSPVSVRVDVAWRRGYETGIKDGKRLAIVGIGVAALALLKRNPHGWAWGAALVVLLIPLAAVGALLWGLIAFTKKHYHYREPTRPTPADEEPF